MISVIESHKEVAESLPSKELKILIKKKPASEPIIDTGKVKGVPEGAEYDKWFSAFLEKEVILLRSPPGFTKGLPRNILKWSQVEDVTKGFVSKAAIHIINEASIRDLRERVLARYPNEEERYLIDVASIAFRPNFIIDSKLPYEEDEMQEIRIGNTLVRLVGFCSRCKAISCNFLTNDRNPEMEPNPTLAKYRKHELGTLFGTYH